LRRFDARKKKNIGKTRFFFIVVRRADDIARLTRAPCDLGHDRPGGLNAS